MRFTVLIPAYNPDETLLAVVKSLLANGVTSLVVVNDGSHSKSAPVFDEIRSTPKCTVLEHAVNLGKGRALKTGLNHIFIQCLESFGVVTADADGQHTPQDIMHVGQEMVSRSRALILGARSFRKDIPFRSFIGNSLTRVLYRIFVGQTISDTQSGLRGILREDIPWMLKLSGENYEYELNMLITSKRMGLHIVEIPIMTVYIAGNRSSHFNPILDSMRIYFVLLRFLFSSVFSSVVDVLLFGLVFALTKYILASFLLARVISSLINYQLNKTAVFHDNRRIAPTIAQYYVLVAVIGTLSYLLLQLLVKRLNFGAMPAKIMADCVLFFASFLIQRDFIFGKKENTSCD